MVKLFCPRYFLFVIVFIASISCNKNNPTQPPPPPPPSGPAPIISSYIVGSFYETGQVDDAKLTANNDVIYLGANVYDDGSLFFEIPVSDGNISNANHLSTFATRNGILSFNGVNAVMDCGNDLLNSASGGTGVFTFATWLNIDEWNSNSSVFKKSGNGKSIELKLGDAANHELLFQLTDGTGYSVSAQLPTISTGQWFHIALVYTGNQTAGNQLKLYIDGVNTVLTYNAGGNTLPATLPFIRNSFQLGNNLKGKMDECFINTLALTPNEINTARNNPLSFTTWNMTKTIAYWKFDDAAKPGKDSRTWINLISDLKQKISGKGIKLRLGISGGAWQTVIGSSTAIQNFANQLKTVIADNGLDGVDFDFEWATTTTQWTNYSNCIQQVAATLPSATVFSVSLHPLYYRLTPEAVNALDFISVQCYGPSPTRFPYSVFLTDVNTISTYGIPKNKMVMGLPFYAVATDNATPTVSTSYKEIVKQHSTLNPALDAIDILLSGTNRNVTFNGIETIRQKTTYVKQQKLAGIMSWHLGSDVDYGSTYSLMKTVVEEFKK